MLVVPKQQSSFMDDQHRRSALSLYAGLAVKQYAVPADPCKVVGHHQQPNLTYVEHELLRQRKTPHGKLTEQDQRVFDKHVHVPAAKHVLLSSAPESHPHSVAFTKNPYHHSQLEQHRSSSNRHQHGWNGNVLGTVHDSRPHPPSWSFPGGVDSVLNQALPLQQGQHFVLDHGAGIPTVLPAPQQSTWVPTASASQEMYGPYWPDGTFNPYRPASTRDNRYYEGRFSANHHATPMMSQYLRTPHLRRSGRWPTDLRATSSLQTDQLYPTQQRSLSTEHHDPIRYFQQNSRSLPSPPKHGATFHRTDSQRFPVHAQPNFHPVTVHGPSPTLQPNHNSEQVAFRDRTFAWANRIYCELLISIQRKSKHMSMTTQLNDQAKPVDKPYIYPRPPKRSGSHFGEHDRIGRDSTTTDYLQNRPQQFDQTPDEVPRPQTAIYSPSQVVSSQSKHPYNTNMGVQHTLLDTLQPGYRPIFEQATPLIATPRTIAIIKEAAASAMSTMELLCEEAIVPWVDGMLLAGCLAYGLGDYMKALTWYQRLLAQDPTHVEAMSNLAAALLALDRREEALHFWSAAVKLHPGYFEAVEHLVGLLCSLRRVKEAVDLIDFVETSLRYKNEDSRTSNGSLSDAECDTKSHASSTATTASTEGVVYDFESDLHLSATRGSCDLQQSQDIQSVSNRSGFAISGAENGRLLALIHAKGNMLYALGDNNGAAAAFEDAILVATGRREHGVGGLIQSILTACLCHETNSEYVARKLSSKDPILLMPGQAELTSRGMFPPFGNLPGLSSVPKGMAMKAAVSTTSNALLSLAKIYQDSVSNSTETGTLKHSSTRDILALYYLSLSLQRSPSTANNVGILLASVQQNLQIHQAASDTQPPICKFPGVTPGSGIELALHYYNYGLNLDPRHAHLYTNFGSLLKDIGQLNAAIKMYEMAVNCDGTFDIALANLANAVKDQGRVADAITYYRRAVQANPKFAEAVCGLATALNSICNWHGRGGIYADGGRRDRIHVNEHGMMHEASRPYGWLNRVVEIVDKQLREGESWGSGTLTPAVVAKMCQQIILHRHDGNSKDVLSLVHKLKTSLHAWFGKNWEGSRIVRLIERAIKCITWQWYHDRYKRNKEFPKQKYLRPQLPSSLPSPSAPTVLPFHTFTAPLSAKQVRQISQRNALRISTSTLRSAWLPATVFPPPPPPQPHLVVGYVSSDFNNHPLAHLMQSIFGLHDPCTIRSVCYATTISDDSEHRRQIERESPVFYDASAWNIERLVKQIVHDGVHILVNLNGYTRGARNEVFAARPAPIQMSFMGFAGTLGAEWCDYIFADSISVPVDTLSPWRRNVSIEDRLNSESLVEDQEHWVYAENIIFARETFFCVDHKQSAPESAAGPPDMRTQEARDLAWQQELSRRWKLRRELFPTISDTAIILGNFNQLYKIDPATLRLFLRILSEVPHAILWLLRFPDLGEQNLLRYAKDWAGSEVASRIIFTDVAPKGTHITRASVVDLFLDTPECNAHTTAADVVWSGTPIITWGKWKYKMCSRMAGSIVASALPEGELGEQARHELLVHSEEQYEREAVKLARDMRYETTIGRANDGIGRGRLMELRRMLWEGRWTSRLFDTKRWVRDIEKAYWKTWNNWEKGEGGDIWL